MTQIETKTAKKPVVLCFSGHDPSGGAGIQADIEAISAQGAHAATIVTALTCQDTRHVLGYQPVNARNLQKQAEVLFKDIHIDAIKIGMTADVEVIKAIRNILKQHDDVPVILDPVLASGAGTALSDKKMIDAINTCLLPFCQLITPNIPEAFKLSQTDNNDNKAIDTAANILLDMGAEHVLVTGTHTKTMSIEHRLYHAHKSLKSFRNARLPYEYHGSGCTLASSIAAFIAKGSIITEAVEKGLNYTFNTLEQAHSPGQGQHLPDRLYQLKNND